MWEILVIVLCLILNALIAATEFAFIAISKPYLRKLTAEGNKTAERVLKLRENPEKTLSVIQLGVTFIGVVAAAVGGTEVDRWFAPWLKSTFNLGPGITQVFSILLFVVPYTFVNVVMSELVPKTLALRNPQWVIFHTNRTLIIMGKILAPIVYLLEKSTKFVTKLFYSWSGQEMKTGEEEIPVGKLVRPYMVNLAKLEGQKIHDVMIPWEDTDKIDNNDSVGVVKQKVFTKGHTRMPVVENDRPIGFLFTKEFIKSMEQGETNWKTLIRPLIVVNENESLVNALKNLQSQHSHMSIVYKGDEPLGIVTIEDILEQVVGEIHDEDDVMNHPILQ